MGLPCMHHILELVLGAIIKDRWGTIGTCYSLFAKFKAAWPEIYEKLPHVLEPHDVRLKEICPDDVLTRSLKRKVSLFCQKSVDSSFLRDDYKEYFQLVQVKQF